MRLPLPPLLQTVARLEGHASGAAVLSPEDLEDLVAQLDSSMAGTAAYIRRGLAGRAPGLGNCQAADGHMLIWRLGAMTC